MHFLKRLHAALSPAAMLVAILALVVAAGGAGYAAGQIGTSGIKNNAITAKKIHKNAVTTKKIKNGAVNGAKIADRSVGNGDLVPEDAFHAVGGHNGVENDCVFTEISSAISGVEPSGYRKTRSGVVRISVFQSWANGAGGDADCGGAPDETVEDFTLFTLPAGYRPSALIIRPMTDGTLVIGGRTNSTVLGPTIPAGAVLLVDNTGNTSGQSVLDFSFTAAGVRGAPASRVARSTPEARALGQKLFGHN